MAETRRRGSEICIIWLKSFVHSDVIRIYAFDFSFAKGSWASDNGATWGDSSTSERYGPESFFAAPSSAVPLPGTLSMGLLGMVLLRVANRRRR